MTASDMPEDVTPEGVAKRQAYDEAREIMLSWLQQARDLDRKATDLRPGNQRDQGRADMLFECAVELQGVLDRFMSRVR